MVKPDINQSEILSAEQFTAEYLRFVPDLLQFCSKTMKLQSENEDVLQEVFVKGLRRVEQPPPLLRSQVKAWLFRVARTTSNDFHRGKARRDKAAYVARVKLLYRDSGAESPAECAIRRNDDASKLAGRIQSIASPQMEQFIDMMLASGFDEEGAFAVAVSQGWSAKTWAGAKSHLKQRLTEIVYTDRAVKWYMGWRKELEQYCDDTISHFLGFEPNLPPPCGKWTMPLVIGALKDQINTTNTRIINTAKKSKALLFLSCRALFEEVLGMAEMLFPELRDKAKLELDTSPDLQNRFSKEILKQIKRRLPLTEHFFRGLPVNPLLLNEIMESPIDPDFGLSGFMKYFLFANGVSVVKTLLNLGQQQGAWGETGEM